MEELIKVNYDSDRPTVLGRDLHTKLEIRTDYTKWFDRMCEYGFTHEQDFTSFLTETSNGGRPAENHQLTLEMSKHICMIQRSEIGMRFRNYFIECEKKLNKPLSRIDILKAALKAEEEKQLIAQRNLQLEQTFEKIEDNLPHLGEYPAQYLAQRFGIFSASGLPHSAVVNYLLGELDPNYDYRMSKKRFELYNGLFFREIYTCAPTGTRYKELMYNQNAYDQLKANFDLWLKLSDKRAPSGLRIIGDKRKFYYKITEDYR